MGKPKNTDNGGCVTTSSECVIWNGPDISFLNLCTGDTISTVMKQVADKVCTLITLTSVKSYDFSCIEAGSCSPVNFIELFQQVINDVCALKEVSPLSTGTTASGCPDCEMAIAACFQIEGNTTLQLLDYVTAIGLKVCDQAVVIETQNAAITQLTARLNELEATVQQYITG